jgi:enamine deaminase RidA (YjgF/YER057c/UK114 family)
VGVPTSTEDGIDVVFLEHGGLREIIATALPRAGDDLASLLHRLGRVWRDLGAELLIMRVFGSSDAFPSCTKILRELFGPMDWPLVCVQGGSCFGQDVAGIQLHAVAGSRVDTIRIDGRPVGRVFEDDFARYCVLGNLQSSDPSRSREIQTSDTIEQMMGGLTSAGMDIHNLVRTWFFIDDILGWYPAFNRVRSEIYSAEGVFDRYVPASTGIGGCNPHRTAVVASALGVQGKEEGVTVREIPSPLQCPAVDYGSSFSRAAELVTPDCRSVFVSGTASIDPEGVSANQGNVDAQIAHTLEIVGAILKSRKMDFTDVTRGNAYFKDPAGATFLERHGSRQGLPASRVVISHCDVCRDDLLFELEVNAVRVEEAG